MMLKLDLAGQWLLHQAGSAENLPGTLPSCNYLDLIRYNLT
jgi:hypothetical protein